MEQTNPDLLHEFENQVNLQTVSPGVRFVNYLIDMIGFYALIFIGGLIYAATIINSDGTNYGDTEIASGMDTLLSLLGFVVYYTLLEGATSGRTLGKLVTGTVAVKEDGSAIGFKEAILRSLSRLVPFEPFSAFGTRPWHDSWTSTLVVKKFR